MIKYLCKSEDALISRWVVSLIRWQSTSSNGNALAHVFWESIYNPTEMKIYISPYPNKQIRWSFCLLLLREIFFRFLP